MKTANIKEMSTVSADMYRPDKKLNINEVALCRFDKLIYLIHSLGSFLLEYTNHT